MEATSVAERSVTGRVWAAVTIRAAWELHLARVRVTRRVLTEAREHVLLSLPEHVDDLESRCAHHVREYLERLRHRRYRYPPPPEELPLQPAWRDQLMGSLDDVGAVLWRLVYGEGLGLAQLEARARVDRAVLIGVREGVRSAFRAILAAHRAPLPETDADLDRALQRLAQMPAPDCDGGVGVRNAPRAHLEACPRCARAVRLIRGGVLPLDELQAPTGWRRHRVSCLALNLHPDGRQHRKTAVETFGEAALRADNDAVLVDLDRVGNHVTILQALAAESSPPRQYLRGAVVEGPGRWTDRLLLGPLPREAADETRARPWGEVSTVGPLPEPLPEPPSAARWWATALIAFLLATLTAGLALKPPPPGPTHPLEIDFAAPPGETWARFDVDDDAYVVVVLDGRDGVELLHASRTLQDKGALATGAGDYIVGRMGDRLLVASSPAPFDDVESLVQAVGVLPRPLEELSVRLQNVYGAEVDLALQAPAES